MVPIPKVIKAKDFNVRSELENHVRNKYSLTPVPKPHLTIEGTRAELAKLHLSDTNIFWGISCKITDTPTEATSQSKKEINRGKRTGYGINGRKNKIK